MVWRDISSFPDYAVSDLGNVKNQVTDRQLNLLRNQRGIVMVGLIREKIQYKRSVTLLVANAFVPRLPGRESFDTPINLDGDRTNNQVSNIMWRPLWFARKYFAQFNNLDLILERSNCLGPIQDTITKEVFESSWTAALKFGLLESDIYLSIVNRTYVVPSFQTFRVFK